MARPLSPRKASHHRAYLFLHRHHHHLLRRYFLGAKPERGWIQGNNSGSTAMNLYSSICALCLYSKTCCVLYLGQVEAPLGALKLRDGKVY